VLIRSIGKGRVRVVDATDRHAALQQTRGDAMEWFSLPSGWPTPVDAMGGWGIALVALLAACVPAWLAARHALRQALAPPPVRLHVVHGNREASRHAA
jgi:hypothetical protein